MRDAGVRALPRRLLAFAAADGELVPAFLGERDRPWLRDLLEQAAAFAGRPFGALQQALGGSAGDPRAGCRLPMAVHVLLQRLRREVGAPPRSALRVELFGRAAREGRAAVAAVAAAHGLTAAEFMAGLFADLPLQRCLVWPTAGVEPMTLAAATNRALVQGMLRHATRAELELRGAARAVLRTAWLAGLGLCVHGVVGDRATIRWSPRQPRASSRALAALVPLLPWARGYRLAAPCRIGAAMGTLVLATGDPLLPGPEPKRYDSALEARFAREFRAAAPDWTVLREPVPLATPHGLAFPDFELRPPRRARWLCEIAGLRDGGALAAKLALLDCDERLLLCLPARAVPSHVAGHPRIVPFRRHVDVGRVCAAIAAVGG